VLSIQVNFDILLRITSQNPSIICYHEKILLKNKKTNNKKNGITLNLCKKEQIP